MNTNIDQTIFGKPNPTKRIFGLTMLSVALIGFYLFNYDNPWIGTINLHTIMEIIAMLIALFVGVLSLTSYSSNKDPLFLFIGIGFLGAGVLDLHHALVTSDHFQTLMPSDLPQTIPWSWIVSRFYLSSFLILSSLIIIKNTLLLDLTELNEKTIYLYSIIFVTLTLLFFTFSPLPRAYFPEYIFHRPEEFIPGALFAFALYRFLKTKTWLSLNFEFWVVLSLVTSVIGQILYMPLSGSLFDFSFDTAHILKILSYLFVLIGLMSNVSFSFKREIETIKNLSISEERLKATFNTMNEGIITIDNVGIINHANPAAGKIFGYDTSELLNKNVSLLMGTSHSLAHDSYLDIYLRTGQKKILNTIRETRGKRKNGQLFDLELTVSEMFIGREKTFLGVVRDITDRKQAEKMKKEFVSTISHELRTPLTSIQGSLGLIETGALGEISDQIKSMITIGLSNTKRLIGLVNDLLDLEKIQEGQLSMKMDIISVSKIANSALKSIEPLANANGVVLKLENCEDDFLVNGDFDRLSQVAINFLSNAIKFSPPKSTIIVKCSNIKRKVRLEVLDNGEGIPNNFRSKIFDRFSQANTSDTRIKGGTGLGLSISKAIIGLHGGEIGYTSAVGIGSTFFFELDDWDLDQTKKTNKFKKEEFEKNKKKLVEYLKLSLDDFSGVKPNILYVEDDEMLCKIVTLQLEDFAFVTKAGSLKEAEALLRNGKFDLYILDLNLPDGFGTSLIQEIRPNEASKPPIIFFSRQKIEDEIIKNVDAAFVKTETDLIELVKYIGYLLGKKSEINDRTQT